MEAVNEERFVEETKEAPAESLRQLAWRRMKKHPSAILGMIIVGILVFLAIFAPLITPLDPSLQVNEYQFVSSFFRGNVLYKKNPSRPDQPTIIPVQSFSEEKNFVHYKDIDGIPHSIEKKFLSGNNESDWHGQPLYILGTDLPGRDVFSRLVYGARVSLFVGVVSQSIALIIGIFLGAIAGYFRGWVDASIMWLVNVIWSFPTILLVIAFSVVLGKGLWQTFIAIGISSWVDIARIVRGQFFSLREMEYVEATRALGYGTFRTIFRHMLPNSLGPILIMATAGFATAIMAEASLSFLGYGVQPPTPSWGSMIQENRAFLVLGDNIGLIIYPCVMIALAVFGFNLLGDGLRDALDPKTIRR